MKTRGIRSVLARISALVNPFKPAGGLAVSDSALRYVRIEGARAASASLRIPKGAVTDGKIADVQLVRAALRELKDSIDSDPARKVDVVVSLGGNVVFSQVFRLPNLKGAKLEESARLNLRMLEPAGAARSYAGYQVVGVVEDGDRLELLGAFADAEVVDAWLEALRFAAFNVLAIEFHGVSIVRTASVAANLDPRETYILAQFTDEGVRFVIVRNNNLYFEYAYPWRLIADGSGNIPAEKLREAVGREMERVVSFSAARFGGGSASIYLLTPARDDELMKLVRERFPDQRTENLNLRAYDLPEGWSEAVGVALRGALRRAEDTFLTLSGSAVITEYYYAQTMRMIAFWRVAVGVVVGFVALLMVGTEVFVRRESQSAAGSAVVELSGKERGELTELLVRAERFNGLLRYAEIAQGKRTGVAALVGAVRSHESGGIELTRITITDGGGTSASVYALAPSAEAALKFKDAMASDERFTNVRLPLEALTTEQDGRIRFTLTFKPKR